MAIFVVTWSYEEESDVVGATASLKEAIGWVREARAAQENRYVEIYRCEGRKVQTIHLERTYSATFFEMWPNKGKAVRADGAAQAARAEAGLAALEASATS